MGKYQSTSLIFKSSYGLCQYFLTSYTYKVFRVLLNWCRDSEINQFIAKYLHRSSSLKYSVTYRICSRAFSSVDRLWDKSYDYAVKSRKTSKIISFVSRTFGSTGSSITYSLFLLFFSCGFGVTSLLLGTFSNIKAILLVLGLLASIFLLVDKARWSACIKGSLFWRITLYVFD
ncbi:MAG: hypothetical protein ACYDG2_07965 [Ruminiclostridium sp.]